MSNEWAALEDERDALDAELIRLREKMSMLIGSEKLWMDRATRSADELKRLRAAGEDALVYWRLGADQDWQEYHDARECLRVALAETKEKM